MPVAPFPRAAIFLAVVLGCVPGQGAESNSPAVAGDATFLIGEAVRAARTLPGYTAVSYQTDGAQLSALTESVRNYPDGAHLVRKELVVSRPDKAPVRVVGVFNREGSWVWAAGKLNRVNELPLFQRPPPLRLATAALLGIADTPHYEIDRQADYFGIPAVKVTVSLSQGLIDRLKAEPDLLVQAMKSRNRGSTAAYSPRHWTDLAESTFPAVYVYVIRQPEPFLLSWQAFSCTGKKTEEINRQDFHLVTPEERLFAVTPDHSALVVQGDEPTHSVPAGHAP